MLKIFKHWLTMMKLRGEDNGEEVGGDEGGRKAVHCPNLL